MNSRIIIAGIVGAITFFLLGWLFYGMLFAGLFTELSGGVTMPPPNLLLIFIGNLFYGFFLAIVFSRWAGVTTASTGLKAGAFIGFFIGAGVDFVMLGASAMGNIYTVLLDVVISTVMFAIAGAVVGAVLGRANR